MIVIVINPLQNMELPSELRNETKLKLNMQAQAYLYIDISVF